MNEQQHDPLVYVVDDDASYLTAVARMLRACGFMVKTFDSGQALLDQLPARARGVIIADLQMPGMSGLELQEALSTCGHTIPVVFLSGHGDVRTTVRAMRHGAEDFLTKVSSKDELIGAVQRAVERDHRQHQRRSRAEALQARLDALTPRERQILEHVVRGKLNKQIADCLAIHERTVKLHRTSITTKLGVHSVAELTRVAYEAGMLQSDTI